MSDSSDQIKTLEFPTLNLGGNAPSLTAPGDPFLTQNEIMGGFKPVRKVGHLTVIDGGKR